LFPDVVATFFIARKSGFEEIGKKDKTKDNKNDKKFDKDYDPKVFPDRHGPDPVIIKEEDFSKNVHPDIDYT